MTGGKSCKSEFAALYFSVDRKLNKCRGKFDNVILVVPPVDLIDKPSGQIISIHCRCYVMLKTSSGYDYVKSFSIVKNNYKTKAQTMNARNITSMNDSA